MEVTRGPEVSSLDLGLVAGEGAPLPLPVMSSRKEPKTADASLLFPKLVARWQAVTVQRLVRPHLPLDKTRIKLTTDRESVKKRLADGREIQFDWSVSSIVLHLTRRRSVVLHEASFAALRSRFLEHFAEKADVNCHAHYNIILAGGCGKLVSQVTTESVSMPRAGADELPEPILAKLTTLDVTTGKSVHLSDVLGPEGFASIREAVLAELAKSPDPYADTSELDATIGNSFALALDRSSERVQITIGIPNKDGPLLTVFVFSLAKTKTLDRAIDTGLFFSNPRVHEHVRLRLQRTPGSMALPWVTSIDSLGSRVTPTGRLCFEALLGDELVRRGWKECLRPTITDDAARVFELAESATATARQEISFYQNGAIALKTNVDGFIETIRCDEQGQIEHAIEAVRTGVLLTAYEFARLPMPE